MSNQFGSIALDRGALLWVFWEVGVRRVRRGLGRGIRLQRYEQRTAGGKKTSSLRGARRWDGEERVGQLFLVVKYERAERTRGRRLRTALGTAGCFMRRTAQ